jgi:hypothetical protein
LRADPDTQLHILATSAVVAFSCGDRHCTKYLRLDYDFSALLLQYEKSIIKKNQVRISYCKFICFYL